MVAEQRNAGAVLIYDGDCAFCNRSLEFGLRHLHWFPNSVAFQKTEPDQFGLTRDQVEASIWLINGNQKLAGHRAASWILRQQKNLLHKFAGIAILAGGPISAAAYRWVAKNRHRLPGGTPACEIETSK
jgi:predicted DCC family thiol-disulfide oxidoreductase YuxK